MEGSSDDVDDHWKVMLSYVILTFVLGGETSEIYLNNVFPSYVQKSTGISLLILIYFYFILPRILFVSPCKL